MTTRAGETTRTRYGPGLGVVTVGVLVAYAFSWFIPVVSALTVAVLLGAVVRNVGVLGPRTLPGTTWATKRLLRAGVVLLGLQLAVGQIVRLDPGVLVVVLVTVIATFAATLWLGRRLGVRRGTTLLVATGFSICGASAAAAMNAVSDSDEDELATTVALVTLFGSAAIVLLPMLREPLGLDVEAFGVWSGASVHEVAQVVATASVAGSGALAVATVVKLTRVILLAPLIAGYGLVQRRCLPAGERPPLVPLFVIGFLLMVGVRSTGLLPEVVVHGASILTTVLLAGALFGLGTSVHLRGLLRTGGRALALGAGSTLIAAAVSLLAITLFT